MSRNLIVLPDDTAQPILDAIAGAQKTLRVKMFAFTDPGLLAGVLAAHARGVKVQVMLNAARRSGEDDNAATRKALEKAGVPVSRALKVADIAAAVEAAGTFDGAAVRDALLNLKDVPGATGLITYKDSPIGKGIPMKDYALVTFDVAKAVREAKAGKVEFRVDKAGNVHVPVGKKSFAADQLAANALALLEAIVRAKPSASKGQYLRSITVSSTMGPREVLTSTAPGFMRASSAAPTRPLVRSESTRWMETKSEAASSSSLLTYRAPASAARSGVRFWLQATTSMPNALA